MEVGREKTGLLASYLRDLESELSLYAYKVVSSTHEAIISINEIQKKLLTFIRLPINLTLNLLTLKIKR